MELKKERATIELAAIAVFLVTKDKDSPKDPEP